MTTSIPEAAGSTRNWDYRYCWLRDGYFVVDALNRLGATETMERYLGYIAASWPAAATSAVAAGLPDQRRRRADRGGRRQRCPAIAASGPCGSATTPTGRCSTMSTARRSWRPRTCSSTSGCAARGTRRCSSGSNRSAGGRSPSSTSPTPGCGNCAAASAVHTFSSVMCWAACDRLARIAARLGFPDRAAAWRADADRIRRFIDERCWSEKRGSFVATADGDALDASLLLLADLRLPRAGGSALRRHRRRDRARAEARRLRVPLRRAATISARPRTPSSSAPSGTPTRSPRWAAATRRASVFERLLGVPQPPRPARPSTSTPRPASPGATSCRPTAWSA